MEAKMKLTNRETELCKYLIQGLNNREISNLMHISSHTVKASISEILKKTGTKNRTHLAFLLGWEKSIEM